MKNLKYYLLIGDLLIATLSSWAQTSITQDDIAYTLDNGTNTATVTGYSDYGGDVNIPNLILHNGDVYVITNIGERAFHTEGLTSVELPLGLTDIANKAFLNNRLTEVVIPNEVVSIGELAFGYNKLERVTLGASVASIANGAFEGNKISTLISYNPNPVDINNAFIFLENEADSYLEVPPESIDEYILAGWTTPFPFKSITKIDQTSIGTIGINTDTPTATLHIKGFTDTATQPNLKLTNANGDDLLTIYDDGSTSGIVANLWEKEIPSNGSAGQVLSYDGTSLTWVDNHYTTQTNCDSSTEGKIKYDTSGAENIMVGCLEDAGVYKWVQLSL